MGPGVKAVVGYSKLGAANYDYDVLLVQRLLTKAAKVVRNTRLDPGKENGKIDSATVEAIEAFQMNFERPTGLVYPGGRTMCRLLNVAEGNPNIKGGYYFPCDKAPTLSFHTGMRAFSSNRPSTTGGPMRAHAGCDLYFAAGTEIYARAIAKFW